MITQKYTLYVWLIWKLPQTITQSYPGVHRTVIGIWCIASIWLVLLVISYPPQHKVRGWGVEYWFHSIHLFVHSSIHLSVRPSVRPSICLSHMRCLLWACCLYHGLYSCVAQTLMREPCVMYHFQLSRSKVKVTWVIWFLWGQGGVVLIDHQSRISSYWLVQI